MHTTTRWALGSLFAALILLPTLAAAAPTGVVVGKVSVRKPGGGETDPTGVVVYLEAVPGGSPGEGERPHPQVRQRDLQFTPSLTVVVAGTTVDFPNDDKVFHNVFSFSEAAKFDLGLYKSGSSKSVTFHRPGVISVYCNIHPEMISQIKVVDTVYYAVVGKDGMFRIDHVPPGNYPLVAWRTASPEVRQELSVVGGGTAMVKVELMAGELDTRHLRKDGTPYGRYK